MRKGLWQKVLVAGALFAGVVLVAGAANSGKSSEISDENPCEAAVWPMIPAHCFGAEQVRAVAFPAMTEAHEYSGLRGLGPDVTSAKADLLQLPTSVKRYRTIEKRIDGVSVLRRVERTALEWAVGSETPCLSMPQFDRTGRLSPQ